jgi:hypothetical protein
VLQVDGAGLADQRRARAEGSPRASPSLTLAGFRSTAAALADQRRAGAEASSRASPSPPAAGSRRWRWPCRSASSALAHRLARRRH